MDFSKSFVADGVLEQGATGLFTLIGAQCEVLGVGRQQGMAESVVMIAAPSNRRRAWQSWPANRIEFDVVRLTRFRYRR